MHTMVLFVNVAGHSEHIVFAAIAALSSIRCHVRPSDVQRPSVEVFKVLLDVLKVFEDVKVLLVAAE